MSGYTTTTVSMFPEDLQRVDALMGRVKAAGFRTVSRSMLIRMGLRRLDDESVIAELEASKAERRLPKESGIPDYITDEPADADGLLDELMGAVG